MGRGEGVIAKVYVIGEDMGTLLLRGGEGSYSDKYS